MTFVLIYVLTRCLSPVLIRIAEGSELFARFNYNVAGMAFIGKKAGLESYKGEQKNTKPEKKMMTIMLISRRILVTLNYWSTFSLIPGPQ